MEIINIILNFLVSISWQAIVVFIFILLRKELRQIFIRLQQAKIPGAGEYTFYEPKSDYSRENNPTGMKEDTEGKWENVANIYWSGYDIMYTVDALLRNGSKNNILHGLTQTLHHIKELNLENKTPEMGLNRIINIVEAKLVSELDLETRQFLARDIATLRDEVGVIVEAKQKSFLATPNNNDSNSAERLALTNRPS